MPNQRRLIPLADGVYTVAEVCRILQPTMTSRRVHYWLDTGLVSGEPVAYGRRGQPTLLTFRQLLEVRTVQHLRDELGIPLPKVRNAFAWILDHVFAEDPEGITFSRGPRRSIIATARGESMEIPHGQGVFPDVQELTKDVAIARRAWVDRRLPLRGHVVADTRVLAGSPTVAGTRIETAIIRRFSTDGHYDEATIAAVAGTYPHLSLAAIVDALEFEGVRPAAA